ncbi:aminotransferase class I/II-fold pyridoxal phosphate-dependent enzyme [Aeribacillus alveayuensis]|jgi:arginine/lysine/ornithine decarboxylase|uniref:aminotransferase class I/II-fold pyridoxal phosphate-dependent enzyme n=1 Tax=Aeribacillus alveayuensis TaxID=279215 RepID=UPI0005D10947|nr:aminotransferase class I/II-fold pyridoxal phosphate-dependent enzyme [Bacillus alveayuensis]
MNRQQRTPLYTALKRHSLSNPVSFHVPGHKYGTVFTDTGEEDYKRLLHIDVTELSGLDDLHQPESVIAEAQMLAAEFFGVEKTFFLVNGSTSGNLVMIFSVCEENRKVIVQRNCHKSIINGLQLVGAEPIFISPQFDQNVRVASYVSYDAVKETIERYPDAAALVLTNPNYYGMAVDLTEIVKLAHSYGIPVLVDEAHGAHFALGVPFPKTAVACGADLVVQSAHKTLPAMTMGSYLHFNSQLVDEEKVKYFLQVFQSSSPSYPIMASLDLARSYLANLSREDINKISEEISNFKRLLQEIECITVAESTDPVVTTDLLKITVQTRSALSGYQLQSLLEKEGIFAELADPFNLLFVYPLALLKNFAEVSKKIKHALRGVQYDPSYMNISLSYALPSVSQSYSYKKLKNLPRKAVSLENAEGLVAAEMLIPYPPGIPILFIGEVITKEHVELITYLKNSGSRFQGGKLLRFHQLEVFEI